MKYILINVILVFVLDVSAQLTLEQVLDDLKTASPENELINISKESTHLAEKNLSNAWKPQISFSAQSTYQSDVTSLNVEIPGFQVPSVNEFQYKAQGEVSQLLLDAGRIKAHRESIYVNSLIEQKQSEIQLDQIKSQVILLYFNILESEQAIKALQSKVEALDARRSVLKAGVDNGAILESELFNLDAAILNLDQEIMRVMRHRNVSIQTLSIFCGKEYKLDEEFVVPEVTQLPTSAGSLIFHELMQQQSLSIDAMQKVKDGDSKPQLVAFGQLGLGNPGLNFLEEGLTDYYIIGMRLNWKLGNLYSRGNDRQINILMKDKIATQKEIFDRNWKSVDTQLKNQIEMEDELVEINTSLLQLRSSITLVAQAQLDNGIINSADYISRLDEEYSAKVNLEIAKIRRLKNQYQLTHHYNLLP